MGEKSKGQKDSDFSVSGARATIRQPHVTQESRSVSVARYQLPASPWEDVTPMSDNTRLGGNMWRRVLCCCRVTVYLQITDNITHICPPVHGSFLAGWGQRGAGLNSLVN